MASGATLPPAAAVLAAAPRKHLLRTRANTHHSDTSPKHLVQALATHNVQECLLQLAVIAHRHPEPHMYTYRPAQVNLATKRPGTYLQQASQGASCAQTCVHAHLEMKENALPYPPLDHAALRITLHSQHAPWGASPGAGPTTNRPGRNRARLPLTGRRR